MDQFMAFASGIAFTRDHWNSEDEYYRDHDRREIPRVRSWPIASAAALLVVMFVVSGVFLA